MIFRQLASLILVLFSAELGAAADWSTHSSASSTDQLASLMVQARAVLDRRDSDTVSAVIASLRQIVDRRANLPDSQLADACNLIGRCYQLARDPDSSEIYTKRALDVRQRLLKPDDSLMADILYNLARLYTTPKRLSLAEATVRQSLEIRKPLFDSMGTEVLNAKALLAYILALEFRYDEARAISDTVTSVITSNQGQHNLAAADILQDVSWVRRIVGDHSGALDLRRQALDIFSRILGPEHPSTLWAVNQYARTCMWSGKYTACDSLLKHVESLASKMPQARATHVLLICSRVDLGLLYIDLSRWQEGEGLLSQTLVDLRGLRYEENQRLAYVHAYLATMYAATIRWGMAADELKRAITQDEIVYGPNHPETINLMSFLAVWSNQAGDTSISEASYRETVKRLKSVTVQNHPRLFKIAMSLARLSSSLGKVAEADSLLALSTSYLEHGIDPGSNERIMGYDEQASIYLEMGLASKALPIAQRELHEAEKDSVGFSTWFLLALYRNALCGKMSGNYTAGLEASERAIRFANAFPSQASINVLADCYRLTAQFNERFGRFEAAASANGNYLDLNHRSIRTFISFASERDRYYLLQTFPATDDAYLTLVLRHGSDSARARAFEAVLKGKAIIADAISAERKATFCSADRVVTDAWRKRNELCSRIAHLFLINSRPGLTSGDTEDTLKSLQHQADSLEALIAGHCTEYQNEQLNSSFTSADVTSRLPADAALWEIIRYTPVAENASHPIPDTTGISHYLVFIADHSGDINMIDLGEAASIDSLVQIVREEMHIGIAASFASSALSEKEKQLRAVSSRLYDRVFAPLATVNPAARRIYLATDGSLGLLPFDILSMNDSTYVMERYEISYLGSGRDLLKFGARRNSIADAVIVASPDFDRPGITSGAFAAKPVDPPTSPVLLAARSLFRGSNACLTEPFAPLWYSRDESRQIAHTMREVGRLQVQENYDGDASESVLRELTHPPQILHIATHGFYCAGPDTSTDGGDGNSVPDNPLLRSGLVFSGVNWSMKQNDDSSNGDNDGILTAYEVSGLNLTGTELVTLSACETGVGVPINGEEVIGLRSAFRHAGARSLLVSLWQVPDKQSADLMTGFYKRWFDGMTKREALRETSLEMLAKCRKQFGHGHPLLWSGFILIGDPN